MTCAEKLKMDHPEWNEEALIDTMYYDCPQEYGYRMGGAATRCPSTENACNDCWNSEVEQPKEETKMIYAHTNMETVSDENDTIEGKFTIAKPVIKDSGNRREFSSGAVRDMQEGKGRCDLMPLEVVANLLSGRGLPAKEDGKVMNNVKTFLEKNDTYYLYLALEHFADQRYERSVPTMFLEVAKHFEEGAKKYGENNWQKGIPPKCYIDSAVRHYLKWLRGDKDEPHDRAFVWNLMCCIWEVDYRSKDAEAVNA